MHIRKHSHTFAASTEMLRWKQTGMTALSISEAKEGSEMLSDEDTMPVLWGGAEGAGTEMTGPESVSLLALLLFLQGTTHTTRNMNSHSHLYR